MNKCSALVRRLGLRANRYALVAMILCLGLFVPALATAATSPYCPTQSLTVAKGGSVTSVDLFNCDGPLNIGMVPGTPGPQHGTITVSPQSGLGNQTVTYVHNDDAFTSDSFVLEDENGDVLTFNVTITPAASSIVVSPTSLPTLTAGASFSQALTSTGGTTPYTYSVSGGTLPPGLSLSSTGTLSGTPTQRGNYAFTVRSQDSTSAFTDKGYTGTVQNPSLSLTPATATASQGVAFNQTLSTSGGVAPYAYQLETGTLPAGISLSASGVLSGTTSAAVGSYAVTIRVTDSSTGPGVYFEVKSFTLTVSSVPSVTGLSPVQGPATGGTTVVVTGTGFSGATGVSFGATPAASFTVNSATQITATAPAGTGVVNVRVSNGSGTSPTGAANQYTYAAAPAVSSISPSSGPSGGGTTVTITGSNFTGASSVRFGATAATGFTVNSATQITATAPAGSAGTVDVTVTTAGGTSATSAADQYTFVGAPVISSISPTSGPSVGGTTVVIIGVNFTGATSVTFGATSATGFTVNSATQITASAPAGTGTVNIRVTTVGGTSATGASNQYTYVGAPTVTAISPTAGPTAGGTTILISGTNFSGATAVTFGATPASSYTVNSATQISATAPAGTGTVDVRITTVGGTSATSAADQYTYVGAPTVTTLSPSQGPSAGGNTVTITGSNFAGTTAVRFGVSAASGFTVNSATQITATAPAGTGAVNVGVTTAGGTSTNGAGNQYVYVSAPVASNFTYGSIVPYNAGADAPTGFNLAGQVTNAPTSFAVGSATSAQGGSVSIDSAGTVTYVAPRGYANGSDSFTYTATNAGGTSAPATATLTIGNPTINIAPATIPAATTGTAYSQTISASGGNAPYSYAVTAGAVPAGLSLSAGGTLSGTPTAGGSFNFTITATDSSAGGGPASAARAYTLTVNAPTISLPATALPGGTLGAAYSSAITPASGGTAPYSYIVSAGALPGGLSLSGTGAITGTPTEMGTFNFSVTATDSSGGSGPYSATQTYSIALTDAAPVAGAVSLSVGYNEPATNVPFNITGGAATSVAVVTAPTHGNVVVNGITATYQPNAGYAGSDSFTYTATNNGGTSAPGTVSVTIGGPTITIAPAMLPAATAGQSYSQALSSNGGAAPYSYAVTAGALPGGLTLSAQGELQGSPIASGSFNFTVTTTDSSSGDGPFSGSRAYSLTIGAPTLVLSPATLPAGQAGTAYAQTISASGGIAPYTYALVQGALPSGMAFSSSGVLSGTPVASGTFSFTLQVTDSTGGNGATAQKVYTLEIAAPSLTITPAALPDATAGIAYSQSLSTSGGIAPYSYALTSGTLPPGVSLSSAGVLSGTPTTAGTFNLRITATDSTAGAPGSTSIDYSLVVAAPTIAIAPATLPAAVRGTAYQQVLTASGGTGPYQFALVSGSLPAGITLSSAGALSGSPTVDGTFNFRVQATDALNFSGTIDYAWSVTPNAPVAVDDATTVLGGSVVVVAVTANDQGTISTIELAAQPAHGLAAVEGLQVRYTSASGYSGSDTFSYTATGPGGTSAPATVRITVNPVPVAVDRTVSAASGIATAVELTEGASGGPFTGATLVELTPANAGNAVIRQTGTGADARYTLTYTPPVDFSGVATARYTLTNAYATSAASTITFQVTARPDPSKDPEVTGLIEAQAASARRFAEAQINNFRQRMESLHGGREESADISNGISFSTGPRCEETIGRLPGQACERDAHRDVAMREDLASDPAPVSEHHGPAIGLWSAGTIRSGGTQGNSQRDNVDFQTDGVSVGADYRVNSQFAWGGGFGWARDDSDVGHNGSRSDGTAQTMALYAGYHPGQRFFVDGLIGYQNLSYDLARYITANGGRVDADRDGHQWLASLSVGADLAFGESLRLTPYGRLDVARGTLDGYVEQGDALYALRYGAMDVATTTGNAGLKLDFRRKTTWGWFSPQMRVEYQRDFQGRSTARFGYADVLDGLAYGSTLQNQDRNRFSLSIGAQVQTESGFNTRLEVQGVLGNGGDSDHGIMLNIEKSY